MKDDLVSQRFGRLVVQRLGTSTHSGRKWVCLCDCGKECTPFGFALKNGTTTSCGCRSKECLSLRTTHGDSGSAEYKAWEAMLQRCTNTKHASYRNYGAKGVVVCVRWHAYEAFLEDMGRKPTAQHSLERKKNALGYEKDNCVWATRIEQNNNTSRNHFIEFNGRKQTVAQWAREKNLAYDVLRQRLQRGWSIARALREPVNQEYVR